MITTRGRIEEVDVIRYLGNVLDCEAGIEKAVRARVAAAWKKLRDILQVCSQIEVLFHLR